jgi:hypothetical protein
MHEELWGTSKSMETAVLVKMLICMLEEKGVTIIAIISDDDSNGRRKAQHIDNGWQLPLLVSMSGSPIT